MNILKYVKSLFSKKDKYEGLPFPLFELTEGEAELLRKAYNKLRKMEPLLCIAISKVQFTGHLLCYKINKALEDWSTLALYLEQLKGSKYELKELDYQLRQAWVKALLKHNGYEL